MHPSGEKRLKYLENQNWCLSADIYIYMLIVLLLSNQNKYHIDISYNLLLNWGGEIIFIVFLWFPVIITFIFIVFYILHKRIFFITNISVLVSVFILGIQGIWVNGMGFGGRYTTHYEIQTIIVLMLLISIAWLFSKGKL